MELTSEVKRSLTIMLKPYPRPEQIIQPVDKDKILKEIQKIKKDFTLFNIKNYIVFCSPSNEIPNILTEIGRLREITFREIGEGTNRNIDIDEFDLYYHQLFIWDEENKQSWRLQIGKRKTNYGNNRQEGIYIQSLFRISDELRPINNESLERPSFEYTKKSEKTMSLFSFMERVSLYFLLKHPEYRYLIRGL